MHSFACCAHTYPPTPALLLGTRRHQRVHSNAHHLRHKLGLHEHGRFLHVRLHIDGVLKPNQRRPQLWWAKPAMCIYVPGPLACIDEMMTCLIYISQGAACQAICHVRMHGCLVMDARRGSVRTHMHVLAAASGGHQRGLANLRPDALHTNLAWGQELVDDHNQHIKHASLFCGGHPPVLFCSAKQSSTPPPLTHAPARRTRSRHQRVHSNAQHLR